MADSTQENSDEAKFNETLKRMLGTPPNPHQQKKDAGPKPDASHSFDEDTKDTSDLPKDGRKAKKTGRQPL